MELKSELYLLIFLTSVCHTLLVVMDTPFDLQLMRFLRLLAALKAKVPDLAAWAERRADGGAERPPAPEASSSLPRLLVAFNHAGPNVEEAALFRPARAFLQRTAWKDAPSVQFARIPTLPGGNLAEMLTSDEAHRAGLRLRAALLSDGPARGRFGRGKLQLSEREWLRHAGAYWEFVQQQATPVEDFFNMLAKGLESYGWPE
ncbi:unnamed protein product [Prorocentrum cordatum]|uniref:Uncharacterized protein n=1 Tax=Prorocentrum cordatum TaxID=2364126 RepID=A0ABN9PUW8_9DINO|nr:unnamed protein product [Polarella glacialis]